MYLRKSEMTSFAAGKYPAMSTLLKDYYSPVFYKKLAGVLTAAVPGFNTKKFTERIFSDGFESLELKGRMKRTSAVLHTFFPDDFSETAGLISRIIVKLREERFGEDSFVFMFLPDYIETYGINDYEAAVRTIEEVTQFVSCEFAVRPFLLKYSERMMAQMMQWSLHENHKVRRLASEGSRSRLPWAMAVPVLKKDPGLILPLLTNLKNDPSEWVRRSVANSLNDISKDHPHIVVDIAHSWKGLNKETDAIVKHGCRTLLKQGHPELMKLYALDSTNIALQQFRILTPEVKIGDSLGFSFSLRNESDTPQVIRLEYAVYFRKQNGQLTKKVFKISERLYEAGASADILRKQSFRLITTRRYYTGEHGLSVIVNGAEKELKYFRLND